MDLSGLRQLIFSNDISDFNALAVEVFQFQSHHNPVYRDFLNHLHTDTTKIKEVEDIPFLPIEFFKDFDVVSGDWKPTLHFESSSTTGIGVSKHFLDDASWYEKSFINSFNHAYGDHSSYCHLALLPSYLERQHSSLIHQVDYFIRHSNYNQSSFFLNDLDRLHSQLLENESNGIPSVLWGVTFALLDFIEKFEIRLDKTIVIETGGMKGRRKELVRTELHKRLKEAFGISDVAGEYGMTELMSQAYSKADGLYHCPPQMKLLIREVNDPFSVGLIGKHGAVNVIDLANVHSCSFIATSDLGKLNVDGSFEILGRMDYSDVRGCNLLVA